MTRQVRLPSIRIRARVVRVDFEIIKDGEVVKSVEVTSETADKTAQLAKEERIRDTGGNYIVDHRTGELVCFAPDVKTEVIRRA